MYILNSVTQMTFSMFKENGYKSFAFFMEAYENMTENEQKILKILSE